MIWPEIQLGEVLREEKVRIGDSEADGLPLLGVSNVEGLHRTTKHRISDMSRYLRVRPGWFAYNPMRINVGSIGWAEHEKQTGIISPDYVVFSCSERIEPKYVFFFLKCSLGLKAINFVTAGSVRDRLYFDALARIRIPLPSLADQQAIVARLDALADKVRQVSAHLNSIEADAEHLLALRFRDAIDGAPLLSMAKVAPSVRRPVEIDISKRYREVGARSFGKGLFIKPDFDGAKATWQKPVWMKKGDLVLSNIKAWEGAIAVACDEHDGCIASHRYITCVPDPKLATASFLAYYLLSDDGLEKIGFASPGTADRNRTLSLGNLHRIEVPVPPLAVQNTFDRLQAEIAALKAQHASIRQANAALLPATLERVFASA